MKMFDWLAKLVPEKYKWQIAAKKVAFFVGKGAVALITYGKVGQVLGPHITPDQMTEIQATAALVAGSALEALHDYLKMRFPDSGWL